MTERKTLLETVTDGNVAEHGIFKYLQARATDSPKYLQGDMTVLNYGYYYSHSGNKYISPLVTRIMGADDTLSDDKSNTLADMLLKICRPNWDKVYNALTVDYSPIENTDAYITHNTSTTGRSSGTSNLTDSGTDNHMHSGSDTRTNTGTDTHALSGTDTTKDTGTDTMTKTGTEKNEGKVNETDYHHSYTTDTESNPGGTSTTQNQAYGFNSSEPSNDTKSVTTVNQTLTTIHRTVSVQTDKDGNPVKDANGEEIKEPGKNSDEIDRKTSDTTTYNTVDTDTKNLTESTEYGRKDTETLDVTDTTNYNSSDNETINLSHAGTTSGENSGSEQYEEHRHGNIGVTSNQQMISEELELRKRFFYETVFADLDKYLCLSIY